ncbi:hypothetical protein XELAEV_18016628mg [Xenopus laevis]|uniref:Uncharacterized protein n=1 Tax=Xenopus laevis TaxID=8355 RepID=A0A974D9I9_XENLA|nr:hypothetical protein XELAEV_18016628mg [Xenopus laevis]
MKGLFAHDKISHPKRSVLPQRRPVIPPPAASLISDFILTLLFTLTAEYSLKGKRNAHLYLYLDLNSLHFRLQNKTLKPSIRRLKVSGIREPCHRYTVAQGIKI